MILISVLGIFLVSLESVSAEVSCGSQTYPDGTGYCCDQGNGANGVWFRGDYYNSCPSGTFRYVSNSGDDLNDGLTVNTPWKTVNKVNSGASGETAIFLGGTYNENNGECESTGGNLIPPPGSPGNPTIIKGHPDYAMPIIMANGFPTNSVYCDQLSGCVHRPACVSSWTTLDHIEFTKSYTGLRVNGDNMVFQDLSIHDTYAYFLSGNENWAGIFVGYGSSNYLTVRGSHIYKNPGSGGMTIYRTAYGIIEDNVFDDSVFLKNGDSNFEVRRNIISNFPTVGILSGHGCRDGMVIRPHDNNSIYENIISGGISGISFLFDKFCYDGEGTNPNNTKIFNNVIYNTQSWGIGMNPNWYNDAGGGRMDNPYIANNLLINNGISGGTAENIWLANAPYIINLVSDYNILYDNFESDVVFKCNDYVRDYGCQDGGSPIYTLSRHQTANNLDWNSKNEDPLFMDAVNGDFNLKAGSPAIDNGTIVQGYHCTASGIETTPGCKVWYGLAPDIGAFEYNPDLPKDPLPPARPKGLVLK